MGDLQANTLQKMQNLNKSAELMGMQHTEELLSADHLRVANAASAMTGTTAEDHKNHQLREALVEQMLLLEDTDLNALVEQYPSLAGEAMDKKNTMVREANASGKDKVKTDFFGSKRRAARKKLADINAKKERFQNDMRELESDAQSLDRKVRLNRFDRQRRVKEGNNDRGPFASFITSVFNGKEADRRITGLEPDKVDKRPYDYAPAVHNPAMISVHGPGGSELKGYNFSPIRALDTGKVVILFTGSGDAGMMERGMGTTVTNYVNAGFRVIQIDYRGYGASGTLDKKGKLKSEGLTERRFYEDGEAIFKGVKEQLGLSNSQIIVHGYSMGGAIASHVVAKMAEENARKVEAGEQPDEPLAGMVMDSAMKSLQYAATNTSGALAGKISKWAAGDYSAEDHLRTIAHYQPDIPVLFVSGDKTATYSDNSPNEDGLTLEDTHLDQIEGFTHKSTYVKEESGHMDCHMTTELVRNFFVQGQQ